MKAIKIVIAILLTVAVGSTTYAQLHDHSKMSSSKTASIKVAGNCELCKARIEKAVNVKGISKAEWNSTTKTLILVYDPSKINTDEIQRKIATIGHDTEKYKANQKAYDKLPECCKFR